MDKETDQIRKNRDSKWDFSTIKGKFYWITSCAMIGSVLSYILMIFGAVMFIIQFVIAVSLNFTLVVDDDFSEPNVSPAIDPFLFREDGLGEGFFTNLVNNVIFIFYPSFTLWIGILLYFGIMLVMIWSNPLMNETLNQNEELNEFFSKTKEKAPSVLMTYKAYKKPKNVSPGEKSDTKNILIHDAKEKVPFASWEDASKTPVFETKFIDLYAKIEVKCDENTKDYIDNYFKEWVEKQRSSFKDSVGEEFDLVEDFKIRYGKEIKPFLSVTEKVPFTFSKVGVFLFSLGCLQFCFNLFLIRKFRKEYYTFEKVISIEGEKYPNKGTDSWGKANKGVIASFFAIHLKEQKEEKINLILREETISIGDEKLQYEEFDQIIKNENIVLKTEDKRMYVLKDIKKEAEFLKVFMKKLEELQEGETESESESDNEEEGEKEEKSSEENN